MTHRLLTVLALVLFGAVSAAQGALTFSGTIGDGAAKIQVHADANLAAPACQAAFEAAEAAFRADGKLGAACDKALATLRAHGCGQAIVECGLVVAAGDAPPNAPGWMTRVGFGTPGYRMMMLPIANQGLARAAADPLRLTVTAASAEQAAALARDVATLGRRAGRAKVEATEGARLYLEDPRFRPLFDGRTLAGWTTKGGRYDGEAVWTVERGAIVGRTGPNGEGGLLYTEETFTSFVLELDVKIEHPFDSGIFVRMVPDLKGAQVTLDYREGGEIGGIYSEGWLEHNPDAKAAFRADAWNHFEVRCTGFDFRIEAWMNGEKIADYALPPGSPGYATAGLIGVQVHGGNPGEKAAYFRNVRVRELSVFGDAYGGEGWTDLVDDELSAWEKHGQQQGYRVVDGELLFPPVGDGHLATKEDYQDFQLRLDFKHSRMANGGLFLRAARDGSNPAFSGCEVQILDDFNWEAVTGHKLKPWQFTGSLYGSVPPRVAALRPIGEWNTYEVLYRGSRLAVALNGKLLYDVNTHALEPEQGAPFAERAPAGFLGLQHHSPDHVEGDASFWYRNVWIRRL